MDLVLQDWVLVLAKAHHFQRTFELLWSQAHGPSRAMSLISIVKTSWNEEYQIFEYIFEIHSLLQYTEQHSLDIIKFTWFEMQFVLQFVVPLVEQYWPIKHIDAHWVQNVRVWFSQARRNIFESELVSMMALAYKRVSIFFWMWVSVVFESLHSSMNFIKSFFSTSSISPIKRNCMVFWYYLFLKTVFLRC